MVVLGASGLGFCRHAWVGPLQEAEGQLEISVKPGPNRHGPTGVVEALAAIPLEHVGVAFEAIAGQASWHTVFSDTQAATAAGQNMVDRFGLFAAINAGLIRVFVERLPPVSNAKFRAQIFKENRIPGVHPIVSVHVIVARSAQMSMCRRLPFPPLARSPGLACLPWRAGATLLKISFCLAGFELAWRHSPGAPCLTQRPLTLWGDPPCPGVPTGRPITLG